MIGLIRFWLRAQKPPQVPTSSRREVTSHPADSRSRSGLNAPSIQIATLLMLVTCLRAANGQAAKPSSASDPEQLVRAGVAAQRAGDNGSAIEDFRKALAIKPQLAEAHAGLGSALAATGQLDAAIDEDTRALAATPNKTDLRMNLGMAYYQKGDLSQAREQFETLHAAMPLDVPTAVMLGYVYVKTGRNADVVSLLTPLERGHENNMDLEYVLAFGLIQSGNDKEGVPRMEKVARTTHRADAYVIAGASLLHRQEMRDARADLDEAMRLDPSIPGLASMAGQARYALGDMEAATAAFQTALRANPRDFNANLDLGAIRLKERDFANARPLLELALEIQPGVPIARLEMAKLEEATDRNAEAAALLEDLIMAEPNWMEPHWELANAYYELDRPADGKRERMIAHELKMRREEHETNHK